jgi:hypothetical protein
MLLFEIKEIRALESSQHMNNPSLHKSKEMMGGGVNNSPNEFGHDASEGLRPRGTVRIALYATEMKGLFMSRGGQR